VTVDYVVAPGRNARIDLLRGIAILVVMLLHFSLTYRLSQSPIADWLTPRFVRALIVNGNYGVTMFFAISGFLITSNTLRRDGDLGGVDLRRFYLYRFARIMPCIALALGVITLFGLFGLPSFLDTIKGQVLPASFSILSIVSVLTFWHNVLMESVGYFNYCVNIYWSLSVEEVFYLLFPLAALALRRTRYFVALCLALVAAGLVYRNMHADNELYFMYGYLACFDAIALGCLAALLKRKVSLTKHACSIATWIAAPTLVCVYLIGIDGHEAVGFSVIALATCALLLASVAEAPEGRPVRLLEPLRWMGRHSYELYLFHIVVLGCMRDLVPRDALANGAKPLWLLVFIAVSCATAAAISRYFSEPANRALRQRFGESRTLLAGQAL
jgi:peptidoglycan/LPS O-acetylase OafA/YrhL